MARSLMNLIPGPKKYRPLVLGAAAVATYYAFFRRKPVAAAAATPAATAPVTIPVSQGSVTYTPGSTTGYAVTLPADGSSWVTVNGLAPSSSTAAIAYPAGMAPDGTYVWNDMTNGGQSTTTIAAATS